jgi:O-antigen ligase
VRSNGSDTGATRQRRRSARVRQVARPSVSLRDPRRVTFSIALLVASSIVFIPGGFDRWTFPKLAVAAVASVLALWAPAAGRLPRVALALVAAWAAITIAAALAGAEPLAQIVGRWPRYEGIFAVAVAALCLVAGARLFGPTAPESRWRTLAVSLSLASWLVAALAVLESFGLRPLPSDLDRPGSLLGQASSEGTWAVVVAVLLGGYLVRRVLAAERWARTDDIALAGVAAALLTVVLSASRIAIASAALIGVLAIVLVLVRRAVRSRAVAIAVGAALAVLLVAAVAIPGTGSRFTEGGGGLLDDRWMLWSTSARLVADHPLLGVGAGGYADAIAAYREESWWTVFGSGVTVDSAHSLPLDAAAIGGIPLLLVLLAGLALGVVAAVRGLRDDPRRLVLVLAVGAALVTWTTAFPTSGTAPLVLVFAGAAVASAPREQAGRAPRIAARTAGGTLAVVLTLGAFAEPALLAGAAGRDPASVDAGFATAQALRPWDPDLGLIRAQVLTALAADGGDTDAALAAATSAADAHPTSVIGAKTLAAAQQFAGRLDDAAATLADLDQRAPGDPQVLGRWGLVEAQRGDLAAARELLERAVAIDPDDVTSWKALGYVYENTGDQAGLDRVAAALERLAAGGTIPVG